MNHNHPSHTLLTRSRTLLFLSFRDTRTTTTSTSYPPHSLHSPLHYQSNHQPGSSQDHQDHRQPLLDPHSHSVSIHEDRSSALPPKWTDHSDEVEALVDEIKPKMVQLDKLTAKHVLPGFTDRSAEEYQIDHLTNEITRDFRKCQALIRKIADCGREIEIEVHQPKSRSHQGQRNRKASMGFTQRDLTMVKNVQIALATKVQSLSSVFQKRQRTYLEQLQGFQPETKPMVNQSQHFVIEDEYSSKSQTTSQSHGDQQVLLQESRSNHTFNQDFIQDRDREIAGIAQSITELADMFKDLGNLVLDQGTLLDRIDYNVEQMSTDVRGAVEELKVATKYQTRSGKCRTIFLLILLIFAAILVLVFKPRHASVSPSPPSPPSPLRNPRSLLRQGESQDAVKLDRRWKLRGRRKDFEVLRRNGGT